MSRPLLLGFLFVAMLGVAIWWGVRDRQGQPRAVPSGGEASVAHARAAAPSVPGAQGLPELARVPALPQAHGADAVQSKLDGFATWLTSTYAKAETEFLGADCTSPPCMIGVRFSAKGLAPDEVRGLLRGVRAEIERRVGIKMAVVHSDEDVEGRDHLWMYGLPAELANEHREALRASAELRHAPILTRSTARTRRSSSPSPCTRPARAGPRAWPRPSGGTDRVRPA